MKTGQSLGVICPGLAAHRLLIVSLSFRAIKESDLRELRQFTVGKRTTQVLRVSENDGEVGLNGDGLNAFGVVGVLRHASLR